VPGSAAYNKGSSSIMAAPAILSARAKTCIYPLPFRVYNTSESMILVTLKGGWSLYRTTIGFSNVRPRVTQVLKG